VDVEDSDVVLLGGSDVLVDEEVRWRMEG